jgi:hypothetical protein
MTGNRSATQSEADVSFSFNRFHFHKKNKKEFFRLDQ